MRLCLKIKKKLIFMYIFYLIASLPLSNFFYDHIIIKTLSYIVYICATLFMVLVHRKAGIKIWKRDNALLAFIVVLMAITFFRGATIQSIYFLIRILICIYFTAFFMEKDRDTTIRVIENVMFILVLSNCITVVLFPNGLYQAYSQSMVWSGGYNVPQWILQQKNAFATYIYLLLACSCFRIYIENNFKIFDLKFWLEFIVSLVSVIIAGSTTSTLCLVFFILFIWGGLLLNKMGKIKPRLIVACIVILSVVFITGNAVNLLGPIIQTITGKTATFSGRTLIWQNTWINYFKHPIFGYGYITGSEIRGMLGQEEFNSTHNMLMQILLFGGIVLLIVFSVFMKKLLNKIVQMTDKRQALLSTAVISLVMIEGLTESLIDIPVFYILMQLLFDFSSRNIKE